MVKKIKVGEEKKTVLVTDKTTKYVKSFACLGKCCAWCGCHTMSRVQVSGSALIMVNALYTVTDRRTPRVNCVCRRQMIRL